MIAIDTETLDWLQDVVPLSRTMDLLQLRLGLLVTYNMDTRVWTADRPDADGRLAHGWNRVARQTVVGWNILEFDLPLLLRDALTRDPIGGFAWETMPQAIDLMACLLRATEPFGPPRRYALAAVAQENLGVGKRGNAREVTDLLRAGSDVGWQHAVAYCRHDVQLVVDLYERMTTTGVSLPPRPDRHETGMLHVVLSPDGKSNETRRIV